MDLKEIIGIVKYNFKRLVAIGVSLLYYKLSIGINNNFYSSVND